MLVVLLLHRYPIRQPNTPILPTWAGSLGHMSVLVPCCRLGSQVWHSEENNGDFNMFSMIFWHNHMAFQLDDEVLVQAAENRNSTTPEQVSASFLPSPSAGKSWGKTIHKKLKYDIGWISHSYLLLVMAVGRWVMCRWVLLICGISYKIKANSEAWVYLKFGTSAGIVLCSQLKLSCIWCHINASSSGRGTYVC